MGVQALPASTVRRISSGQALASVHAAIKELVENALDAGATSLDIRLEDGGLKLMSVVDNGRGIAPEDRLLVGRRHCTSKLSSDSDLSDVHSYGFRGEALNSLCTIAGGGVSVVTRVAGEPMAYEFTLDTLGGMSGEPQPRAHGVGTTVTVRGLFQAFPVRRHAIAKALKAEMDRVTDLLARFAIARPACRIAAKNDGKVIFQKAPAADVRAVVAQLYGAAVAAQIVNIKASAGGVDIDAWVPATESCAAAVTTRSTPDRTFVFVNGRPVVMREVASVVTERVAESAAKQGMPHTAKRYPFMVIQLTADSADIDGTY